MTNNAKPAPDRYALVGHPVEHSRSPLIHTVFARATGQRLTYELIDAEPTAFETAVRGFAAAGGKGLNVTVPHKQAAFALCTKLSDGATAAGAVNTISIVDGGLHGHNTDGIGLVRDLKINLRRALAGKRILVLGAGGAARGVIGPLLDEKPEELVVANRSKDRADEVAANFAGTVLTTRSFDELAYLRPFDVVINATSAGLKGEAPPFPPALVGPRSFCYDLVYGSADTPFVAWAKTHGAEGAVHGWGMLVEQAAESFAIWRGVRPDTKGLLKQVPR